MFRLQIVLRDRGPRRQIVERISSSTGIGRPQEQLYRRHFARETGETASKIRQRGVGGALEQWQQGLADYATFCAHAAEQQLLAFLVGPPEFQIEEDRDQDEDDGKKRYLRRKATMSSGRAAVFQVSAAQRYPKLA